MIASIDELAERIVAGERRALARAITLVESDRPDHEEMAEDLLTRLLPHTGAAIRLGISGPPGVGKSTLIEALGRHVVDEGLRLAVLAIDPSSRRGGGAVLADKTRMQALAQTPEAFIRPSPSGRTLGGVARRTRESALLCEAAGFDLAVIETVGVGQSETAVAEMVDSFLLLLAPGGGDELQGLKRGIVELADILLVTKADGALASAARRIAADYRAALRLLRPRHEGWTPPILTASAVQGEGIAELWAAVREHRSALETSGALEALRARQQRDWFRSEVESGLLARLYRDAASVEAMGRLENAVAEGRLPAPAAARRLLTRIGAMGTHAKDD